MPLFDLPEPELRGYRSATIPPADLDAFWAATLGEARALAQPLVAQRIDTGLTRVTTYDVTFSGFGGHPIKAWYHRPAEVEEPLPVVVQYIGYGGGRGLPHEIATPWVNAGHALLIMDTRGQGSAWNSGDTPDPGGSGPATPGYMSRGLDDPETYYYRRVFTDGVRAVDSVAELPGADPSRVVVTGGSQGGGITLAVASLRDDLIAAMPDVPFLSDFRRGTEIAQDPPYTELSRYLAVHRDQVERAFATLAYFDTAVLATRASAPALFSVALMDTICPPSTVYAAYNAYGTDRGDVAKEIRVYPFNNHEGGLAFQQAEQLRWLATRMG